MLESALQISVRPIFKNNRILFEYTAISGELCKYDMK